MTQEDVIDELKNRTGFYKNNIRDVLDALDSIIIEHMNTATIEEPSEMRLFKSWRLGGKRVPERKVMDPRNGQSVITKEKVLPYCKFKPSFKARVNNYIMENDHEEIGDE